MADFDQLEAELESEMDALESDLAEPTDEELSEIENEERNEAVAQQGLLRKDGDEDEFQNLKQVAFESRTA